MRGYTIPKLQTRRALSESPGLVPALQLAMGLRRGTKVPVERCVGSFMHIVSEVKTERVLQNCDLPFTCFCFFFALGTSARSWSELSSSMFETDP